MDLLLEIIEQKIMEKHASAEEMVQCSKMVKIETEFLDGLSEEKIEYFYTKYNPERFKLESISSSDAIKYAVEICKQIYGIK